jgi:hypothetical protein
LIARESIEEQERASSSERERERERARERERERERESKKEQDSARECELDQAPRSGRLEVCGGASMAVPKKKRWRYQTNNFVDGGTQTTKMAVPKAKCRK